RNAFGKLAGSTQVAELGTIETPIVLTNTLSVGTAVDALARYTIAQPGNEQVRSVNPLVGETNDGGLNDIRGFHVTRDHVLDAIRTAKGGPVAEGAVGAGTGPICHGWDSGVGTHARSHGLHGRRPRADELRREPRDRGCADLQVAAAAVTANRGRLARRRGRRRPGSFGGGRRTSVCGRVMHARRRDRRTARR